MFCLLPACAIDFLTLLDFSNCMELALKTVVFLFLFFWLLVLFLFIMGAPPFGGFFFFIISLYLWNYVKK